MAWYQLIIAVVFTAVLFKDFAVEMRKPKLSLNLIVRGFMVVVFPYLIKWLQKI